MLLKDIMTHNVEVVSPGDTLEQAARRMEELDVGPLPVCEDKRVVGMLTDRDITVRATAAGCDPKTTLVSDTMSQEVVSCYEDQDVSEAAQADEGKADPAAAGPEPGARAGRDRLARRPGHRGRRPGATGRGPEEGLRAHLRQELSSHRSVINSFQDKML